MYNPYVAYSSFPRLRCVFYSVIIRNQSLQEKYPGGLEAFIQNYGAQSNDRLSVFNDMGLDVGDLLAVIEKYGCRQCEDFTMLDTVESEMWCNFKPEMRERPLPVDTGGNG